MNLKVDHEELGNVTKVMHKDKDDLDNEVQKLLNYLEELRMIWKGDDSDEFYDNAFHYISRMKIIPTAIGTVGDFVDNVDKEYIKSDDNFSEELQKEKNNMYTTEPPSGSGKIAA